MWDVIFKPVLPVTRPALKYFPFSCWFIYQCLVALYALTFGCKNCVYIQQGNHSNSFDQPNATTALWWPNVNLKALNKVVRFYIT
ncbi:hypothetical protein GDO81_010336 [Engystomops pustulosus]|uniref:Uncharacterized protein n=1 Tax=Engystomops pustulosus TaxID=76066 RepID=A0AAV7BZY6_ENGPU|nr:hypothetical protein GDO81_010336 [Engystomops pustulosus]